MIITVTHPSIINSISPKSYNLPNGFIKCLSWSIIFILLRSSWFDKGQKHFRTDLQKCILSVFHNHLSAIWIPDPASNYRQGIIADKKVLQWIHTACLTFSTASLLRKLCNCYTGFFSRKGDQMTFLPTRSETVSREQVRGGLSSTPPPPTLVWLYICNKLHINRYVGTLTEKCCLCPDEVAAWKPPPIPNILLFFLAFSSNCFCI